MKKRVYFILYLFYGCVSGIDQDVRNKDIFQEAKRLAYPLYEEGNFDFDGKIMDLVNFINSQTSNTEVDPVPNPFEIEGVVTIPSNFGFARTSSGTICDNYNVFARSFLLQDKNAGILVAYGLEPPVTDTAQAQSMKYILNARNPNMAIFGQKIKLRVRKVQKYGNATNFVAIVTDFEQPIFQEDRKTIKYQKATGPLTRASDLYRVREVVGIVRESPKYVECPSGSQREFQAEYQTSYVGELCANAISLQDALNCTGSKVLYKFKLTLNLGAGTLSGFDIDQMFSYNLSRGAYVKVRGPVVLPIFAQDDSHLAILIDQKHQVETLRAP